MSIDRLDTDDALTALRDVLNRQRTIDQLQPGDKVRMPWGRVWTFVSATRHGEYASAEFAEADLPMPVGSHVLFTLAD